MSQYERIVSYIYRYNQGVKGANVGYARVEKRGRLCRLFVQMRAVPISQTPQVYLYRQLETGIETVYVGSMAARGSNLFCKADSDAEQLFQTQNAIGDMEGIFIYVEENTYFVTSWKNDSFYLGNWQRDISAGHVAESEKEIAAADFVVDTEPGLQQENSTKKEKGDSSIVVEEKKEEGEIISKDAEALEKKAVAVHTAVNHVSVEKVMPQKPQESGSGTAGEIETEKKKESKEPEVPQEPAAEEGNSQRDVQMQSICGVCPFKRRVYDYGKKILMTFPSMKPFEPGVAKACVRMELQDIGCLPIASWSLSGNRFLLHGYYCYRHLIFAQLADGKYVLGVPGIYSEKEKSNAIRFGFSKFQSIGDFGPKQGAFGYWMLSLPDSGNSDFLTV